MMIVCSYNGGDDRGAVFFQSSNFMCTRRMLSVVGLVHIIMLEPMMHIPRGACWSVVYRCVNKKKTMRKGAFFRAGQCAALSSFRVGKMLFCRKRVCFYKFCKMLQK